MSPNPDELRTSAAQVKEMIADLQKVLEVIGPDVPLKVSGTYA